MKENNLLASVALFSELYNNEKYNNISDIIAEFIKGAVVSQKKWVLNSTELTKLLEDVYEFKIPEAVIRTTVRNNLKGFYISENGFYHFDSIKLADYDRVENEYSVVLQSQQEIFSDLVLFIETRQNEVLTVANKSEVLQDFRKYLLDAGSSDKYSKVISAFLIKNKENEDFKKNLNLIKEGLILYQGIRYTADLNELGRWNSELTIFLSTEHLFNALGYNGVLYRQVFDDFYKLVSTINLASRNRNGEKLIQLKYFSETKDEIDSFFETAEAIFKGHASLDPTKSAMVEILKDCKSPSDIKTKKIRFENDLRQMGITLQEFNHSPYKYVDYVVDDEAILKQLQEEAANKGRSFDEGQCRRYFRMFTKVNYFRGGESKTNFEKIGFILLTGNRFGLFLAHQTKVKFNEEDIPFAKDIDYMTSKFWFKLKKGFNDKDGLPKSFDVMTKAQMILSGQVGSSVYRAYSKLKNEYRAGTLSKEEALERSYQLREKNIKPEEITKESIEDSLAIIDGEAYFEDLYREKVKNEEVLQSTLQQNKELLEELKRRDEVELNKAREERKRLFETAKEKFVSKKWKNYKWLMVKEISYFLFITLITILPILAALFIKGNPRLNTWLEEGNRELYVFGGLAFIFLAELLGRSYLFNKEKVKRGWKNILIIFQRSKFKILKETNFIEYGNQFENEGSIV
jgi:hypothetical protein